MRTVRSSSRLLGWGGVCLPQCMLGYTHPGPWTGHPLGLGLDTPRPGPDTPRAWAWTPLWADTPKPGPGHPLGLRTVTTFASKVFETFPVKLIKKSHVVGRRLQDPHLIRAE